MLKTHTSLAAAAAVAVTACFATSASAQLFDYELSISSEEAAGGALVPTATSNGVRFFQRIGGIGQFGGETVAFVAQNNSNNGLVTSGTPGTPFVIDASFPNFIASGLDGGGFEIPGQINSDASGLFFADGLNDGIFRFNPTTGIQVIAREADIQAVTGASSANVGLGQAILPSGDLLFYDGSSDGLLLADGTSGAISTFASAADLAASPIGLFAAAGDVEDADDVDGFGLAGNTIFLGNGTLDSIFSIDVSASDPLATATQVLSPSDISGITGNSSIDFRGGIVQGGDGFVYFYESQADSILRFDPSAPSSSLQLVLSDAELEAGPAGYRLPDRPRRDGRRSWLLHDAIERQRWLL